MNINQSPSKKKFPFKKNNQPRNNPLILFICLFLPTLWGGYFLWQQIQLNAAEQLIHDCLEKHNCNENNISTLEKLVKAKKILKLFDLQNMHLENAHLENVHLQSTHLENAHLENAHLENSHLKNVNLSMAHLEHAHLEHAHLENLNLSHAHLEAANLQGANLQGAYISNDHLDSAYLIEANLQGLHLYNVDFEQASFYLANLSYTYFYRANFHHANLYRANLHHAYLIQAQNLTPIQIKSACNWQTAIYKGKFDQRQGRWIVDELANQNYIQQLKQDHHSDPNEPVDCTTWQ